MGLKIKDIPKLKNLFHHMDNLDRIDRIQIWITHFLKFTLIVAVVGAAFTFRWTVLFVSLLVLFLTFTPEMIEKRYRICLPVEFEFIIVIFIYATLFLGELHGYYTLYWWWDIVLHIGSAIAFGFAGFLVLYILFTKNKIQTNPLLIAVFSFCFAMAIGAVWEIMEFSADQLLGLNMQKSGLVDTMWDLIVDALGALLTSSVGYFYFKGGQIPVFRRLLRKFIKENPKFS